MYWYLIFMERRIQEAEGDTWIARRHYAGMGLSDASLILQMILETVICEIRFHALQKTWRHGGYCSSANAIIWDQYYPPKNSWSLRWDWDYQGIDSKWHHHESNICDGCKNALSVPLSKMRGIDPHVNQWEFNLQKQERRANGAFISELKDNGLVFFEGGGPLRGYGKCPRIIWRAHTSSNPS